jgi:D-arabinose 1-dehydrogenase-like Zn-dependent alcohol dehydrogenase
MIFTYRKEDARGPEGQFLKAIDKDVKYPWTPGHKMAGTVDKPGEQVEGLTQSEKM